MRWINRVGTLVIAVVFVAGPPAAAILMLAYLRPGWPTPQQFQAWLREPLTATSVVVGVVAVVGAGWLMLVSYLIRETFRALRRRRRLQHLRLPGPAQLTASSIAGVAVLALPGLHAATHPPGPPAGTAPAQPSTLPPAHHQSARVSTGINLPGGNWLPASTALAASAVASLIWLRRRQHYQPAAPSLARPGRDADLRPLPGTVEAIATALADQNGPAGSDTPAVTVDELPDGIITLDGPGAHAAARGLIVSTALATVLAAASGPPARSMHLRSTDLAALLPGIDFTVLQPAGVRHGPAGTAASGPGHVTIRLEAGADPGARWHVDADGVTTGTGLAAPRRLCILESPAATDLINLVQAALGQHAGAGRPVPDTDPAPMEGTRPQSSPAAGNLRLIGGCELTIAGQTIHVRRNASWQILAYLAIHPAGGSKNDLIRACWPHQAAGPITQRLHTTISDLRTQLRPVLGVDPILRTSDHYRLNPHAVATDLQTWHQTAHLAASADTADARLRAARELISLYHGELAAGQPWPWIEPAREALRRDALDACTAAAAQAETAEAAALLQHALAIDPDNRYLRQRLIRHH